MDIPVVNGDEYVLVTVHRFVGKTSRQVGRRPFAPVGSEGEAFEGGVIRVGEAWIRGGRGERSIGSDRETGRGGGSCAWTRHLVSKCRGARMLWQGREGETSGQWCGLTRESRGYIHGRVRGEK